MKLSLYYPAKPYVVTQAFGIYNPAYEQFGFNKHNGVDIAIDKDHIVKAMINGVVIETGYIPTGAGNYVRYRTNEMFEVEGHTAYVEFMYMHAEKVLVSAGDKVKLGQDLIIADNTGFSTGPHTHISAYLFDENKVRIPLETASNNCFNHAKYFNGLYADDIGQPEKFQYMRDLGRYSVGSDVFKLQQFLVNAHYGDFTPTGFYGAKTQEAVKAYQDENGIQPISGYFGQITRAKVNSS